MSVGVPLAVAGSVAAVFEYQDERVVAFLDMQPVDPGHLLVVPIRHAPHLADLGGETAAHLMCVAHRLTATLRASSVRCEGVNLFLADGEAAGREVFHSHLHVFPRFRDDGFGLRCAPEYHTRRPPREERDRLGTELRAELP